MPSACAVPIIVGVGEVKNLSRKPEDAAEPAQLMLDSIQKAAADTGLHSTGLAGLLSGLDCINVVQTWTWPYADLPGLLASKLKASPKHRHYSEIGGEKPVKLMDDALRKVAHGQTDLAVVTGGEALASLAGYMAAKGGPPPHWTDSGEGSGSHTASDYQFPPGINADHSIGFPIQVYPLYENAFRHHRSQTLEANHTESAELYSTFAQIASSVDSAWNHGKSVPAAKDIATVGKRNRMICFPYTLLMNAFNTVNMASACIITSTAHARALGISQDRWIYLLGAAGTRESYNLWERPSYVESSSINRSLTTTLTTSGLRPTDIDLLDIYSCFPIVPKLAAAHLGLPADGSGKPLSVIGGLTSFGGAGNNYSLHAVAEMTRLLRSGRGRNGLVLANGGVLTYHHAICLSTHAPGADHDIPESNPLPPLVDDVPIPPIELRPEGEAVIETYTVDFDRENNPTLGHVIGRLDKSRARFVANHGDEYTLQELASWTREPIGRRGWVTRGPEGNNVFRVAQQAKL